MALTIFKKAGAPVICLKHLVQIFTIGVLVFCADFALGENYTVSGTLESTTLIGPEGASIAHFEIDVRDANWIIKISQKRFPEHYTNVMLLDYVAFNDGDEIKTFACAQDRENIVSDLVSKNNAPSDWKLHPDHAVINMAWVEQAQVPHADMSLSIPVLFYIYCSSKYLDTVDLITGQHSLEPPFFVDGKVYSFDAGVTNVPAAYTREAKSPFLPESIAFLHNDKWLLSPGKYIGLSKEWAQFTNAVLQVESYTNTGALSLPLNSVMQVYSASQLRPNGPLDITLTERVTVHLERVLPTPDISSEAESTELHGLFNITDKRFMRAGLNARVQYATNRWLTEEDVEKLPEYADASREANLQTIRDQEAQKSPQNPKGYRALFVLLIVFTGLGFLVFAIKNINQKTKGR